MFRFKFILWMLAKLIQRTLDRNPEALKHASSREVSFRICTRSGSGRTYRIADGRVTSQSSLGSAPGFALTFSTGAAGFRILSAKDSKGAFLQGLHDSELAVSGDFTAVMWFQRLTEFLRT